MLLGHSTARHRGPTLRVASAAFLRKDRFCMMRTARWIVGAA